MVAVSPDAFAALYRRYERPLLAFLRRRVSGPEVAADLLAETFAAALEALRDGAGPTGPVGGWLFGIARHKLADSYRRGRVEAAARRRLAMEPVVLTDAALERVDALHGEATALELVEGLPPDQRDAVLARVLEEREYPAIAGELACSEQVVRKRVSRGLAALRARMGDMT